MRPEARRDGLVVREVGDETLVYDLDRHKAHCLNRAAAEVWRLCDGRRDVRVLTALLRRRVDEGLDESAVLLALDDLSRARLLRERLTARSGYSRREVVRRLGRAAAALPLVISVVSPRAVDAATPCQPNAPGCQPLDTPCTRSADCCSCCCRVVGGSQRCRPGGGGCLP